MQHVDFDADAAFSRTRGWTTANEQKTLRKARIAIAGLGGVGGNHLLALTRLGIGSFNIADFDTFEVHNFNRQPGATMSNLNKPKIDVMADMALDINPTLNINKFSDGITAENVGTFLDGVDVYVDGIDFFAFEMRAAIFAECARRGIPAVTAGPLGMGAALMNFMPDGISFEDYFRFEGCDESEKSLRFLIGLTPKAPHRHYVADPSVIDIANHKVPSTPMGCYLCSGVMGTEVLKHLLKRGKIIAAPRSVAFDAYTYKVVYSWMPWGNANPIQKLKIFLARRMFKQMKKA